MKVSASLQAILDRSEVGRVVVNGKVESDQVTATDCFSLTPGVEEMDTTPVEFRDVIQDVNRAIVDYVQRGDPDHDNGDFAMTFTPDSPMDADSEPGVNIEWRPHWITEEDVPPAHYFG